MIQWMRPDVIETERLRLRPPSLADVRDVFEYGSQAETVRYLQWKPLSDSHAARRFLERAVDQWHCQEHTRSWIIELRSIGRVIGALRATSRGDAVELGFVLNSNWHRHRYGSEAVHAVVAHAHSDGVRFIMAVCDVDNVASRRLLEATKFEAVRLLRQHLVHPALGLKARDCVLYRHSSPQDY